MRTLLIAIVILIIGFMALVEYRYGLVVESPIVAKLDRLTGDVWIVNAGVWRKVQTAEPESAMNTAPAGAAATQAM